MGLYSNIIKLSYKNSPRFTKTSSKWMKKTALHEVIFKNLPQYRTIPSPPIQSAWWLHCRKDYGKLSLADLREAGNVKKSEDSVVEGTASTSNMTCDLCTDEPKPMHRYCTDCSKALCVEHLGVSALADQFVVTLLVLFFVFYPKCDNKQER